ncbi:luciferin sulfotransferase-like isoform X2 [Drosophila tropicalis]|uniref:luciferin sulfotransferase-like isoform X2 n=1 Tax=Drosophila tropicalis TaxID=46794 RepID=UPI0035AB8C2E
MNLQGKEEAALWLPLQQDWGNRWCTMPQRYLSFCDRIDAFETRASDVFVVTFMKCGTTWMQELAWLLLNRLDFDQAKRSYLMDRSIFMELSTIRDRYGKDSVTVCDQMSNPRLIKTHLPAQLLPREIWLRKRKIIYVARNAKDVVVSSYHFMKGVGHWEGSIDEFVDEFMKDRVMFTSYLSHFVDFYRMRNEKNIFFVTYEEMKRDLKQVIERLVKFLDCQPLDEIQMEQLLKYLSFENMKSGEHSNPTRYFKARPDFEFMRRGIVGSYKDELSAAHREALDNWTQNYLNEYGLNEFEIFGNI